MANNHDYPRSCYVPTKAACARLTYGPQGVKKLIKYFADRVKMEQEHERLHKEFYDKWQYKIRTAVGSEMSDDEMCHIMDKITSMDALKSNLHAEAWETFNRTAIAELLTYYDREDEGNRILYKKRFLKSREERMKLERNVEHAKQKYQSKHKKELELKEKVEAVQGDDLNSENFTDLLKKWQKVESAAETAKGKYKQQLEREAMARPKFIQNMEKFSEFSDSYERERMASMKEAIRHYLVVEQALEQLMLDLKPGYEIILQELNNYDTDPALKQYKELFTYKFTFPKSLEDEAKEAKAAEIQGDVHHDIETKGATHHDIETKGATHHDIEIKRATHHDIKIKGATHHDTEIQGASHHDTEIQGATHHDPEIQQAKEARATDIEGVICHGTDIQSVHLDIVGDLKSDKDLIKRFTAQAMKTPEMMSHKFNSYSRHMILPPLSQKGGKYLPDINIPSLIKEMKVNRTVSVNTLDENMAAKPARQKTSKRSLTRDMLSANSDREKLPGFKVKCHAKTAFPARRENELSFEKAAKPEGQESPQRCQTSEKSSAAADIAPTPLDLDVKRHSKTEFTARRENELSFKDATKPERQESPKRSHTRAILSADAERATLPGLKVKGYAKTAFTARQENELSFKKGRKIYMTKPADVNGLAYGYKKGVMLKNKVYGYFPADLVTTDVRAKKKSKLKLPNPFKQSKEENTPKFKFFPHPGNRK